MHAIANQVDVREMWYLLRTERQLANGGDEFDRQRGNVEGRRRTDETDSTTSGYFRKVTSRRGEGWGR